MRNARFVKEATTILSTHFGDVEPPEELVKKVAAAMRKAHRDGYTAGYSTKNLPFGGL
jgi:hypothetical protein